MDLLLMGTGMGIVGGLMPSSLHLIAMTQVALHRWVRALLILVGLPVILDGALLVLGGYSLFENRRKGQEELARSATLTYGGVSAAILAELTAPGTWVYWLTVAGPVMDEGKVKGYLHVVPFFAGGLVGYYSAAILSVRLM